MIPSFIDKRVIPHKSGIYIFKDAGKNILYVGKAIDLYHRVASYFSKSFTNFKTSQMVEKIKSLETIVVESELEALILEANLIKKHKPPYNIRLTDDKDYLYIAITKGDFPQIITARKKDLRQFKYYFGPFPSSTTVKNTLKQLRRVFPWCSNPPGIRNKNFRPCFYYHINLCPGACKGEILKKDYNLTINRFLNFLKGNKGQLINELEKEMAYYSKAQSFEEALKIKKIINNIEYITQPNRVSLYLENKNFLEQENLKAISMLKNELNLKTLPSRIEAYDISNIQGLSASGSMVVLTNGEIDKSQYRRFKIQIGGKPNDYAMHQEIIKRRLKHPEWGIPQLILIDGGRGQARAAKQVTSSSTLFREIPIFGIAKRFEWLYPPEKEVIKLSKRNLGLRLIQKIRDESHRFAISYHRKLRSKTLGI